MVQNKNSKFFSKENLKGISLTFLSVWMMFIIVGIITLIIGLANQKARFIWIVFFSNVFSLIPYGLLFFPALYIYIGIREIIEEKKYEESYNMVKAILIEFHIAALISIIIILIFGEPTLTVHVLLEFFAILSLWIFFVSIIALVVFVLYSYFGEA
jgi:hypothetical protein